PRRAQGSPSPQWEECRLQTFFPARRGLVYFRVAPPDLIPASTAIDSIPALTAQLVAVQVDHSTFSGPLPRISTNDRSPILQLKDQEPAREEDAEKSESEQRIQRRVEPIINLMPAEREIVERDEDDESEGGNVGGGVDEDREENAEEENDEDRVDEDREENEEETNDTRDKK